MKWVGFPDESAFLQRAIFPSGSKGLLLYPADNKEGNRIRARAGSIRLLGEMLQQTFGVGGMSESTGP